MIYSKSETADFVKLFNNIITNQDRLIRGLISQPDLTDICKNAQDLVELATNNEYMPYRKIGQNPNVFLVGYSEKDPVVAKFIRAIGENLHNYEVMSETYDGQMPIFRANADVATKQLNAVFREYQINPVGRDNSNLFEQVISHVNAANRVYKPGKKSEQYKNSIFIAMDAFKQRQNRFVDQITEKLEDNPNSKILYIINQWQLFTPQLLGSLKRKRVEFISFLPKEFKLERLKKQ